MSRSIRILPELDAPISPIQTPKLDTAIVAFGRGDYIGEVRGPYQSLSELATDMDNLSGGSPFDLDLDGHSAAYRWARDFMANGARGLRVVEPTLGSLQTATYSGDGSQKSFDLIVDKTGGAGVLTISPVPGQLHVEHPVATDLVENVDYIVDWSRGIIHFKTAPAAAADNIQVEWKEYTAANVATALALLENINVQLISGAYFASDNGYSLQDEVRDHVNAAATKFFYRRGAIEGYYGDVAGIVPLAYNNDYLGGFAHKSGYFNGNLADPSVNWLEYKDPSSVVCGITAARDPWVSIHEKSTQNLNMIQDFNSTEVATLEAAFINYFANDGSGTYRIKNGWNWEGASATFRWWDSVGLWIFVGNSIYDVLLSQNIIGNIQIERDQYLNAEQIVINKLIQLSRDGAIAHPRDLIITHRLNPVNSEVINALRAEPEDRTPAQESLIQTTQSVREDTWRVYYDEQGWLHKLDIPLGGR
jgi:hypothetical protein